MSTDIGTRWQYVVANVGAFGAQNRLARSLAFLGERGYELVTVYDKASNWFNGMEKGFMLFKREVPTGTAPDGTWCATLDATTMKLLDVTDVAGDNYGFPEGEAW